jgi:hypothetical protein
MDIDDSCIPLAEIRLHDAFSNLFPKRSQVLDALKKHIHDHGYDDAFPLIVAHGPWAEHDMLLDGHCRRDVCEELGIEQVRVARRFFETEDEALAYMIHVQKDRRNLTDADIVNCLEILDKKKKAGRPKKEAQHCANFQTGKSAEELASTLGISTRKLEMARTVADHGGANITESIISGNLSINKAYKEIQMKRKMEEPDTEPQQEDSAEATEVIDKAQEQNMDHDMIHDLASEVNDSEDDARNPGCWVADIFNGLDSGSIDYLIVGRDTPPATINENQQIFLAPWTAPSQVDPGDIAKDVPNEETPAPTPPKQPSVANLTNYDAEGWYALEQEWAKFIPAFVPEPPEGIDVATAPGESPAEGQPLPESGMTQIPTDAEDVTQEDEIAVETAPALAPRIAQVLDLKATDSNSVIVKFLKRHGLCHINSFGTVRINRERLLAYLLERDANSLEGFSRLLAEFQAGPQIDLPPDEDLQIDLHNDFFHYPYGERWFWEQCPTKDDNGLTLHEGGFGANVLAFMTEHGLNDLDDIVQKVAEMHEELRPKGSAL